MLAIVLLKSFQFCFSYTSEWDIMYTKAMSSVALRNK